MVQRDTRRRTAPFSAPTSRISVALTRVDDQVFDGASEEQDRDSGGGDDAAKKEYGAQLEAQGGDFGDGGDELRVDADGEQHRPAADAGDEVGEAHEEAADGASDDVDGCGFFFRGHRGRSIA